MPFGASVEADYAGAAYPLRGSNPFGFHDLFFPGLAEFGRATRAVGHAGRSRMPFGASVEADYAGAAYPLRGSNPNFAKEKPRLT